MGAIKNISWDSGHDPATSIPSLVLVRCDDYKGPEFPGCGGPGMSIKALPVPELSSLYD
jgi:hypothetical protein